MIRLLVASVVLVAMCSGCAESPGGPVEAPAGAPTQPTSIPNTGIQASITGISPNTGGTGGATLVEIVGTGLRRTRSVTFGGVAASRVGWAPDGTRVFATTPLHAAGIVDVALSSENGLVALSGGFTYGLAAPMSITGITPSAGLSAGGTYLGISGHGFQSGATVTFDGVPGRVFYQISSSGMGITTRPHAPGRVQVVVTNPDGQTQTTTYTYVTPVFSNFNGTWQGYAGDEGENVFALTVRDNVLVSVTCGGITLDFSSPPSTASGEFAVKEPLGAVTGGLLRSDHAEGTLSVPGCTTYGDTIWFADRR